jgi:hypothetical protein
MLHEFKNQLSGTEIGAPPFVIRASDLDKNFKICSIMDNNGPDDPYRVDRPGGPGSPYRLIPQKTFDVCENGKPVRYAFFAQRIPGS